MPSKTRMGSDPLGWIHDSRAEEPADRAEPSKLSKQSKPQPLKAVRERTVTKQEPAKSTQAGLRDGWTRATFIVREGQLEKLKNLAWWERKEIKQVLEEALSAHLDDKKVPPRPQPSGE